MLSGDLLFVYVLLFIKSYKIIGCVGVSVVSDSTFRCLFAYISN